jgi:hypothetical protein
VPDYLFFYVCLFLYSEYHYVIFRKKCTISEEFFMDSPACHLVHPNGVNQQCNKCAAVKYKLAEEFNGCFQLLSITLSYTFHEITVSITLV